MTHQETHQDGDNTSPVPPPRRFGKGMALIAALAIVVGVGLTGNMLSTAFGQGWGGFHGWRGGGGFMGMGGPMTPAQIDERIDRMTKHLAIELDATADQQAKIAGIAKATVAELRPLREKAQAARSEAVALLTAPTIDRAAVEKLRADQLALAETASKRIAQSLADAFDVLTPEQRRKVGNWAAMFDGPWAPWRRG
jgi:protein CpxP